MKKILLMFLVPAYCYGHGGDEIECFSARAENYVSAVFPLKKIRDKWEWHRVKQTKERPEYGWIAEPGVFIGNGKNRSFRGNGIAFAASIGTLNLKNTPPQEGGLEKLIEISSKNAYYTRRAKTEMESEQSHRLMEQSLVIARVLDGDSIALGVFDKATIAAAKKGGVTHMRMRAFLPYPGESYECYARIEKTRPVRTTD